MSHVRQRAGISLWVMLGNLQLMADGAGIAEAHGWAYACIMGRCVDGKNLYAFCVCVNEGKGRFSQPVFW